MFGKFDLESVLPIILVLTLTVMGALAVKDFATERMNQLTQAIATVGR